MDRERFVKQILSVLCSFEQMLRGSVEFFDAFDRSCLHLDHGCYL